MGAKFGRGAYFAQNASKSDRYTTCTECPEGAVLKECSHVGGERCIFVVRVLLGESKSIFDEDCRSRSRAPDRPDGSGHPYDSLTAQRRVHGGQVDHMEFVIFKEQMALVQYLIYYRHEPACQCHNCESRRQRS